MSVSSKYNKEQVQENRLVLYVSSPRDYSDVIDIFFKMLKKHWDNCPYELFFSTNWNNNDYLNAVNYNSNDLNDGWVERTISSLSLIKATYVLLLCDDIFINGTPNIGTIEHILDIMDEKQIDFCRLKRTRKGKKIDDVVRYLPTKMPYAKNLQIGIFRASFLLTELKKYNCSAWEVESIWNELGHEANSQYFNNVIGVKKTIVPFLHGIEKGRWIPSSKRKIEKCGISVNTKRKELTLGQVLLRNIKTFGNRITPSSFRKIVKKVLKKIGFRFVSKN